ncbi:hypothetical protein [Inhella crocodyli]|uniref:hypothetical protein n=1 Tax=Inhella crocodyli TaxID=2499851 RepID=UPI00196B6A53|nr:hypothetical protein [Inhella crocodyli]
MGCSPGGRLGLALAAAALLAACASRPPAPGLQPFQTDGCSRFADRSERSRSDWCHCCVAHDLAYWQGGTVVEREAADAALRHCVTQASGSEGLGRLMLAGVRVGGGPAWPTPYRWGYGWPAGRGYAPLSPDEAAQVRALRAQIEVRPEVLACPITALPSP